MVVVIGSLINAALMFCSKTASYRITVYPIAKTFQVITLDKNRIQHNPAQAQIILNLTSFSSECPKKNSICI